MWILKFTVYQLITGLPFPSISRSPSIRFTAASHVLRQQILSGITFLFVIPKLISLWSRWCSYICNRQTSTAEVLPGVEIACYQAPWNTSVSSSRRVSIFSRCTTPQPRPPPKQKWLNLFPKVLLYHDHHYRHHSKDRQSSCFKLAGPRSSDPNFGWNKLSSLSSVYNQ